MTAAADVVAGYAVAGLPAAGALPLLIASGVLLYAGGVVMNDVCDAAEDARARPERPIPSGQMSRVAAAAWGMGLLAAGVAAAFAAGPTPGMIASLLALTVLLYDVVAKHRRWLGPFTMGACRGLNLLLGVSAAPAALFGAGHVALVPLLYIAAVTLASAHEVEGGDRRMFVPTFVLLAAAMGMLVLLAWDSTPMLLTLAPFVVLLLLRVGPPFWAAWHQPDAVHVRTAVKRGVLSIIVLDAAITAIFAGPLWALLVLTLALPAARLGARFAVT